MLWKASASNIKLNMTIPNNHVYTYLPYATVFSEQLQQIAENNGVSAWYEYIITMISLSKWKKTHSYRLFMVLPW